jgi:hypothetical protein
MSDTLIYNGEKELLKVLIHGQRRGTFLGKEVLWKMCESHAKRNAEGGCYLK